MMRFFSFSIQKVNNYLWRIFFIYSVASGFILFMIVASGGVLSDLEDAFIEIEDLEKRNLLENPPDTISEIAKREIRLVGDSIGLKKYIKETEASFNNFCKIFYIFFITCILAAAFKILFL